MAIALWVTACGTNETPPPATDGGRGGDAGAVTDGGAAASGGQGGTGAGGDGGGGEGGAPPVCADADGDGFGDGPDCLGIDCDETSTSIHEGAFEVCEGADTNCDGVGDAGIGDTVTTPATMAPLDIMSLHLIAEGSVFGETSYTLEDVLVDLRALAEQSDLDATRERLGLAAGTPAGFVEGDVCELLTELIYLLETFPQEDGLFDEPLVPGEKIFLDSFGFSFITPEPELFEPLPHTSETELAFHAGEGAIDGDEPVLQLELVAREKKIWVSITP